ncbi:MAG: hypothetical protein PUP91_18825 [Rhizonema sp. PD37]|nr:hypothetical protein [Rhizonema sp. PD37]
MPLSYLKHTVSYWSKSELQSNATVAESNRKKSLAETSAESALENSYKKCRSSQKPCFGGNIVT